MRKFVSRSLFVVAGLALAPFAAADRPKAASVDAAKPAKEALAVETIVQRHLAALGGEDLLRNTKTLSYTVTGEKAGKKFTKTVHQARPNLLRVDIQFEDGAFSKGFDGKVAWVKKGNAPAEAMNAEDTAAMAAHAEFGEPLVDYAKRGTKVKLIGTTEIAGAPAYKLEVAFANGQVEYQLIDSKSFLLVMTKSKANGKVNIMRAGDYKQVQGRMVNHSVTWESDAGSHTSTLSSFQYDKPVADKMFAMPK